MWFAILGGVALVAGVWLRAQWDKPGPLPEAKAVVVPHGGTTAAADALKASGVIENATAFEALSWLTFFDGSIRAAEFNFPAKASVAGGRVGPLRTSRPLKSTPCLRGVTPVTSVV